MLKRTPIVVNVQDIYPDIAISLGMLRHPPVIWAFRRMEKAIYNRASSIVVISDGFRDNLLKKGVPRSKIEIVPNWADPDDIRPGPKDNAFRRSLGVGDRFTVIYSGNLSHNSNLEPFIEAADLLRNEPFSFVVVGEGVHKSRLQEMAMAKELDNVRFLPFQPLAEYPQVLAAADMNLVTLNTQASIASVPSKMFKIMASGRPAMAITDGGNEVHRLITQSGSGMCVPPDDAAGLADALRYAESHRGELEKMGMNARIHLEEHFSRRKCVDAIEEILARAVKR
jgi:colanic acid biosynthesis glycosyl transferase WcaI